MLRLLTIKRWRCQTGRRVCSGSEVDRLSDVSAAWILGLLWSDAAALMQHLVAVTMECIQYRGLKHLLMSLLLLIPAAVNMTVTTGL